LLVWLLREAYVRTRGRAMPRTILGSAARGARTPSSQSTAP